MAPGFSSCRAHRDPERVRSPELARAVYPANYHIAAESRLYGVLGGFGTKATQRYRKRKWFFDANRERMADGSAGYMIYACSATC
jgi:hypothetical protein